MRTSDVYVLFGVAGLAIFALYAAIAGSHYNQPGTVFGRMVDRLVNWTPGVAPEPSPPNPAEPPSATGFQVVPQPQNAAASPATPAAPTAPVAPVQPAAIPAASVAAPAAPATAESKRPPTKTPRDAKSEEVF